MPDEILSLANSLLHQPVSVSVTPTSTPVELIEQGVYFAEKIEKRDLLKTVLRQRGLPQALVFSRTKHGADRIARDLVRAGISARALHGDKSQGARQRALKDFKENRISVLVATDIAARGLDICELPLVINFDLPNIAETYVHRIGRTGRAGMEGTALSFCAEDERPYLKDIEKLTRTNISVLDRPEGAAPTQTERPSVARAERQPSLGRRKAATPEKRKAGTERQSSAAVDSAPQAQNSRQGRARRSAPTEALASKYPKAAAGRGRRAPRRSREDLSMDISTPRTNELSIEASARVRAKIQAKLAEREAKQGASPAPAAPQEKTAPRFRSSRSGRGRGQR